MRARETPVVRIVGLGDEPALTEPKPPHLSPPPPHTPRMKTYKIKPIDKTIPRRTYESGLSVLISNRPFFFRAPMLASKIHRKWDAAFCESTTLQLEKCGMTWDDLALTEAEVESVGRYKEGGSWGSTELGDKGDEGGMGIEEREREERKEVSDCLAEGVGFIKRD